MIEIISPEEDRTIRHLVPSVMPNNILTILLRDQAELFNLQEPHERLLTFYSSAEPCMFKANNIPDVPPIRLNIPPELVTVNRWVTYWQFRSVTDLTRALGSNWWYGDFCVISERDPLTTPVTGRASFTDVTQHVIKRIGRSAAFLHVVLESGGELIFTADRGKYEMLQPLGETD